MNVDKVPAGDQSDWSFVGSHRLRRMSIAASADLTSDSFSSHFNLQRGKNKL